MEASEFDDLGAMLRSSSLRKVADAVEVRAVGVFLRSRFSSLTDAFHALDRQSAGHLNLEQFKDGLKEFGYNWQDAESVFRALDANRLGLLSLYTFLSAFDGSGLRSEALGCLKVPPQEPQQLQAGQSLPPDFSSERNDASIARASQQLGASSQQLGAPRQLSPAEYASERSDGSAGRVSQSRQLSPYPSERSDSSGRARPMWPGNLDDSLAYSDAVTARSVTTLPASPVASWPSMTNRVRDGASDDERLTPRGEAAAQSALQRAADMSLIHEEFGRLWSELKTEKDTRETAVSNLTAELQELRAERQAKADRASEEVRQERQDRQMALSALQQTMDSKIAEVALNAETAAGRVAAVLERTVATADTSAVDRKVVEAEALSLALKAQTEEMKLELASISAQTLKEGRLEAMRQELVQLAEDRIESQVQRQARTIQAQLESKIEEQLLKCRPLDVAQLVDERLEGRVQRQVRAAQTHLEAVMEEQLLKHRPLDVTLQRRVDSLQAHFDAFVSEQQRPRPGSSDSDVSQKAAVQALKTHIDTVLAERIAKIDYLIQHQAAAAAAVENSPVRTQLQQLLATLCTSFCAVPDEHLSSHSNQLRTITTPREQKGKPEQAPALGKKMEIQLPIGLEEDGPTAADPVLRSFKSERSVHSVSTTATPAGVMPTMLNTVSTVRSSASLGREHADAAAAVPVLRHSGGAADGMSWSATEHVTPAATPMSSPGAPSCASADPQKPCWEFPADRGATAATPREDVLSTAEKLVIKQSKRSQDQQLLHAIDDLCKEVSRLKKHQSSNPRVHSPSEIAHQ